MKAQPLFISPHCYLLAESSSVREAHVCSLQLVRNDGMGGMFREVQKRNGCSRYERARYASVLAFQQSPREGVDMITI